MKQFQKIPFHPLLFAAYPVLALLATNIHEVSPSVVWRPLGVVLIATGIVLLVTRLILGDWAKASLATSFIILLVFTYGRFYEYLKTTPLVEMGVVRHRYLAILFFSLLIVGIWLISKRIRDAKPTTGILNIISIVLVALPLFQTAAYLLNTSSGERAVAEWTPETSLLPLDSQAGKPDVYYIILDTYARADRIETELGFDNSGFITELEEMGFYVAGLQPQQLQQHPQLDRQFAQHELPARAVRAGRRSGHLHPGYLDVDQAQCRSSQLRGAGLQDRGI